MDTKEMEYIYHKYYQSLFLYALSLTKNVSDAQDLVAETFVKAIINYDDSIENIKVWLIKVLRNLFVDQYRKKRRLLDEGKIHIEWLEDPYDTMKEIIKEDQKRWLYDQIYRLPLKEREIMLMSLTLHISDEQISEQTLISEANIRVIRHRVKMKLIDKAKKEGYL